MSARVISIINQKGGVGKTTSTINLGYSMNLLGKKVLIVDLDPQGNCTSGFGLEKNNQDSNTYDLLVNSKLSICNYCENLSVIPASEELVGIETDLTGYDEKEFVLRERLQGLKENFDIVLIDTPPSLGFASVSALIASEYVLIPVQAEYYALEGLASVMEVIDLIKFRSNPLLNLLGVFITMYDGRTVLSKDVLKEVKENFGDKLFDVIIPRSIRVAEAPGFGKPLLLYDPSNSAAIAYLNLADRIMQKLDLITRI